MNRATYRRLRNSLACRLAPLTSLLFAATWTSAQRHGRWLARLTWMVAHRARRRTLRHLALAFPDLDTSRIRDLGLSCFAHLGMSMGEVLYLSRRGPGEAAQFLDIDGWEHVEATRSLDRGVLIVTGHCGNWELLGPAFSINDAPLSAIVRSFDEEGVDDLAVTFREGLGTESIRRGEKDSARRILRILRGQGNLLVLIDHDIIAESVWVPFFGRLANTAVGPVQMAIRHSMIVIPAFCERQRDGRHRVRFDPPVELPQQEHEATALLTRLVEDQVRRRPEQWTWMHKRWRRQPADVEA